MRSKNMGEVGGNNKQNLIPFIRVAKSGFWHQTALPMNPWLITYQLWDCREVTSSVCQFPYLSNGDYYVQIRHRKRT